MRHNLIMTDFKLQKCKSKPMKCDFSLNINSILRLLHQRGNYPRAWLCKCLMELQISFAVSDDSSSLLHTSH